MIKYALIILSLLSCAAIYITILPPQNATKETAFNNDIIEDWKPLEVTGDAIAWEIFGATREHESCTQKDEDGYDICLVKPEYGKQVTDLNGKRVTIMGYMFPLEQSEKQRNFLIGPYPMSCPFHYHASPTQMIEVFADEPIAFSYEPITLKGNLKLDYNEETGMFYYLNQSKKL